MIRTIDGFHADDDGDWVAELSCLHGQHVRHQPPFRERPWVLTEEGRASRIGAELDCPLCDRAELPDDLREARTAGPFDEETLPAALQADHVVAERTWGLLRVLAGTVGFEMATDPPIVRELATGEEQPIPPGVTHRVRLRGRPARLEVRFLVRGAQ